MAGNLCIRICSASSDRRGCAERHPLSVTEAAEQTQRAVQDVLVWREPGQAGSLYEDPGRLKHSVVINCPGYVVPFPQPRRPRS